MTGEIAVKRNTSQKTPNASVVSATRAQGWLHIGRLQRDHLGGCGGAMLNLESGDRIELFYEDAPATTIRATVGRLLSDREEGLGVEAEDYVVCWIEISVHEPSDMVAKQVVLLCTDFQYRLNGRRVTLLKRQDWYGISTPRIVQTARHGLRDVLEQKIECARNQGNA